MEILHKVHHKFLIKNNVKFICSYFIYLFINITVIFIRRWVRTPKLQNLHELIYIYTLLLTFIKIPNVVYIWKTLFTAYESYWLLVRW